MFRLLSLAALAFPVVAQTTLLVGPGGYAQIADALAVAQPNDTIVVQAGVYLPFTCNVGVRIVAQNGAIARSVSLQVSQMTRFQVPPGQTASVQGLRFEQCDALNPQVVFVGSGQATFEQCTFSPTHPFESYHTLIVSHADLVLQNCTFSTFNGAVLVDSGSFAATGCTFYGVDPQGIIPIQPAAVELRDSTAQLTFCTLRGAVNSWMGAGAGYGMRVSGASHVSLVDCFVAGGNANPGTGWPPPSIGLENLGTLPVQYLRTTFVGGWSQQYTPNGSIPVQGAGAVGPIQQGTLVGLSGSTTGLRVGQAYLCLATTAPATFVVLGFSAGLVAPTLVPQVVDPIRFDPSATSFLGMGAAGPGGTFYFPASNALPAAAIGTPLWFHAIAVGPNGLRSANPVGGLVH